MSIERLHRSLLLFTASLVLSCGGPRKAHHGARRPADHRSPRCADASTGKDVQACEAPAVPGGVRRRMVHNNQHENGLTPEALGCAERLLAALTASPLSTATFQALTGPAREELITECPHAPELMKYVVSCALAPGESVAAGDGCEPWPGEVGLCKSGEFGDWATSAPTSACLEIVSACVLARTNALDKQVALSLRGPNPALSTLPSVPVETHYRGDGGKEMIKSFRPCKGGAESDSPDRDCGWQPRYVGKCEADDDTASDVKLALASGSARAPMMVRVCSGIHGCDHGERRVAPSYADWIADGTIAGDRALSFDCPSAHVSETTNMAHGYYSVMIASPRPGEDVPCDADVKATSEREGAYPASEEQVFTFQEGAFYGNLFLPGGGAAARAGRPAATLSAGQFACYSKQSKSNKEDLYFARRLCMSPREGCFASSPEPCWTSCGDQGHAQTGYHASCKGGPDVWRYPITTYLNQSDDLLQ